VISRYDDSFLTLSYISDPRRESGSEDSSSLVQKLMEGSMVITAQEDNKKEMPIIQSNQSAGTAACQVSTSPTFYARLFRTFRIELLLAKEYWRK
jgi:hypothetical protein